ncbi:MAG: hypothetical protein ABI689_10900 [Thermoanaerobaculia bacterium]
MTFSRDPEVCVLEWTSTADGHEFYVSQLYGNGRLETRTYLDASKPVPTTHVTTDLTPDELATWLDDMADSRLYAYSRTDIDRRIEATGRRPMMVDDIGQVFVRIRYELSSVGSAAPTTMSNTFIGDEAWYQADRYPEVPEFATIRRMWQRFSTAVKSGVSHAEPRAPAPLPIHSWTAEERAQAGWTRE